MLDWVLAAGENATVTTSPPTIMLLPYWSTAMTVKDRGIPAVPLVVWPLRIEFAPPFPRYLKLQLKTFCAGSDDPRWRQHFAIIIKWVALRSNDIPLVVAVKPT